MRGYFGRKTAFVAALLATTSMAMAEDVEVLHWWTSGSEAAMLAELRRSVSFGPRTSLNVAITPERGFATAAVPRAELKAIAALAITGLSMIPNAG